MARARGTKKAAAKPKRSSVPAGVPSVEELLALWRRTREPRIADVLGEIDKLAPTAKKPPGLRDDTKWRAWANSRSLAELPALLAATPADRVDVLDRFEPDPRIGRAIVDLIVGYRPWSGTDRYQVHIVACCDRLAKHADVGIVERLARLCRVQVENTGYITSSLWFDREISAFAERLRAEVQASLADDDLRASCTKWLAAFRSPVQGVHSELLAAVYAAPDDDGPRLVLADVLQAQKASPHGELISLQLAPPTPEIDKRVGVLLRKSAAACCAPAVWKALWVKSVRFERGFIAGGMLYPHSRKDFEASIGAVEWATVHSLDPGNFAGFGSNSDKRQLTLDLLTHPAMQHLRRVGPIDLQELAVLISYGVPLPWRSIAVHAHHPHEDEWPVPGDGTHVFPKLACLLLDVPDAIFEQLRAMPWLRAVELRRRSPDGDRLFLGDLFELPR